jgi:hypothetical protein
MSNENLINLLREVRPSVQFHIGLLSWSNGPSPFKTDDLLATERTLASIDAALAEKPVELEWRGKPGFPMTARIKDGGLTVWRKVTGEYGWICSLKNSEFSAELMGYKPSLEEAKAAAIEASRRLR